ncbi:hypothetical protein R3P38DRAFT_3450689 [Favolaschia claudopus]|uniref:Uncharacterized protein n=1 Tax=Favolaschia claudopus TaxID=2862362 RepID=A0AAV9ZLT5_9AGAR
MPRLANIFTRRQNDSSSQRFHSHASPTSSTFTTPRLLLIDADAELSNRRGRLPLITSAHPAHTLVPKRQEHKFKRKRIRRLVCKEEKQERVSAFQCQLCQRQTTTSLSGKSGGKFAFWTRGRAGVADLSTDADAAGTANGEFGGGDGTRQGRGDDDVNLRTFRHVGPVALPIPDTHPSPSYSPDDIPRRPRPRERGGSDVSNASSRISVGEAVAKREREKEMGRMSPSFGLGGGASLSISNVSSATVMPYSLTHSLTSQPSTSLLIYTNPLLLSSSSSPPRATSTPTAYRLPMAAPTMTTPPTIPARTTLYSRRSSRPDSPGARYRCRAAPGRRTSPSPTQKPLIDIAALTATKPGVVGAKKEDGDGDGFTGAGVLGGGECGSLKRALCAGEWEGDCGADVAFAAYTNLDVGRTHFPSPPFNFRQGAATTVAVDGRRRNSPPPPPPARHRSNAPHNLLPLTFASPSPSSTTAAAAKRSIGAHPLRLAYPKRTRADDVEDENDGVLANELAAMLGTGVALVSVGLDGDEEGTGGGRGGCRGCGYSRGGSSGERSDMVLQQTRKRESSSSTVVQPSSSSSSTVAATLGSPPPVSSSSNPATNVHVGVSARKPPVERRFSLASVAARGRLVQQSQLKTMPPAPPATSSTSSGPSSSHANLTPPPIRTSPASFNAAPPSRRPFVSSGCLSPTSSTGELSSDPALLTPWDWSDTGGSSGEERGGGGGVGLMILLVSADDGCDGHGRKYADEYVYDPGNGDEYANGLCVPISPWIVRCWMGRRHAESSAIHDPSFYAAHQQAMMIAKQAYLAAVGQQAMAAAGEEWERGSSVGGSVYRGGGGGSVYGGNGGSVYGGGGGMAGWGPSLFPPGPQSMYDGGGGGAWSDYGRGGGGNWNSSRSRGGGKGVDGLLYACNAFVSWERKDADAGSAEDCESAFRSIAQYRSWGFAATAAAVELAAYLNISFYIYIHNIHPTLHPAGAGRATGAGAASTTRGAGAARSAGKAPGGGAGSVGGAAADSAAGAVGSNDGSAEGSAGGAGATRSGAETTGAVTGWTKASDRGRTTRVSYGTLRRRFCSSQTSFQLHNACCVGCWESRSRGGDDVGAMGAVATAATGLAWGIQEESVDLTEHGVLGSDNPLDVGEAGDENLIQSLSRSPARVNACQCSREARSGHFDFLSHIGEAGDENLILVTVSGPGERPDRTANESTREMVVQEERSPPRRRRPLPHRLCPSTANFKGIGRHRLARSSRYIPGLDFVPHTQELVTLRARDSRFAIPNLLNGNKPDSEDASSSRISRSAAPASLHLVNIRPHLLRLAEFANWAVAWGRSVLGAAVKCLLLVDAEGIAVDFSERHTTCEGSKNSNADELSVIHTKGSREDVRDPLKKDRDDRLQYVSQTPSKHLANITIPKQTKIIFTTTASTGINDGAYHLEYLEAIISGDETEAAQIEQAVLGLGYGPLADCSTVANCSSKKAYCPFPHRDETQNLSQPLMKHLGCSSKFRTAPSSCATSNENTAEDTGQVDGNPGQAGGRSSRHHSSKIHLPSPRSVFSYLEISPDCMPDACQLASLPVKPFSYQVVQQEHCVANLKSQQDVRLPPADRYIRRMIALPANTLTNSIIVFSAAAHQRVFEEIESIVKEDTGESLKSIYLHASSAEGPDGYGKLSWTAYQHRGQAKGLGLHLQKIASNVATKVDLHESHRTVQVRDPYDHLRRLFRSRKMYDGPCEALCASSMKIGKEHYLKSDKTAGRPATVGLNKEIYTEMINGVAPVLTVLPDWVNDKESSDFFSRNLLGKESDPARRLERCLFPPCPYYANLMRGVQEFRELWNHTVFQNRSYSQTNLLASSQHRILAGEDQKIERHNEKLLKSLETLVKAEKAVFVKEQDLAEETRPEKRLKIDAKLLKKRKGARHEDRDHIRNDNVSVVRVGSDRQARAWVGSGRVKVEFNARPDPGYPATLVEQQLELGPGSDRVRLKSPGLGRVSGLRPDPDNTNSHFCILLSLWAWKLEPRETRP